MFLTSSRVFNFFMEELQISSKIHKNICFKSSFFIKSGIQLIMIIFQCNISKSNHISLKMSILSFKKLASIGVIFRLSQNKSP
ncbi:MAG: hypothetical protein LBQ59_05705 [Candidatus Peribacteria bacterium]|nr:hypothetical protein [Candidatus Peribacteria bacterium]